MGVEFIARALAVTHWHEIPESITISTLLGLKSLALSGNSDDKRQRRRHPQCPCGTLVERTGQLTQYPLIDRAPALLRARHQVGLPIVAVHTLAAEPGELRAQQVTDALESMLLDREELCLVACPPRA